jgi:hypothetical protein
MTYEHIKLVEANMDEDTKKFIDTAFELQKLEMTTVWLRGYIEGFALRNDLANAPEWLKTAAFMMATKRAKE